MSKYKPEIQLMDVEDIFPYEKNAKVHSETQIESLSKVIKSQGWDVPIVVDRHGVIIKGHGRRLAAMRLGLKQVPVIVRTDLSDAQVKAARLSDNRVAMGDFDVDAIKEELENLRTDGFDLSDMGFGEKELDMMLGDLDAIDFDVFEPINAEASQSASNADPSQDATPLAPKEKEVAVSDLVGFKHMPARYRDAMLEFAAKAVAFGDENDEPNVSFGKYVTHLLESSDEAKDI